MSGVAANYHWLTFTTPCETALVLDVMGGVCGETTDKGGLGHPRSTLHESGARVYHGSSREDQPVVVSMSGEVCETHAGAGLEWCEALRGSVTRFDVALDLEPAAEARGRLVQMHRAWQREQVQTSIRQGSHRLVKNVNPAEGWTGYWGGKTAAMQLRAYDRRGPLRLEFEVRPDKGERQAFGSLLKLWGAASVWRSYAMRIRFPMPWYVDLLTGDVATWEKTRPAETEFEQALRSLVAQWGSSLWAFQTCGVDLNALAVSMKPDLRRDVRAKLAGWAAQASAAGYDGQALLREIEQCPLK